MAGVQQPSQAVEGRDASPREREDFAAGVEVLHAAANTEPADREAAMKVDLEALGRVERRAFAEPAVPAWLDLGSLSPRARACQRFERQAPVVGTDEHVGVAERA